ncbi:hypothetical protein PIB30_088536 [Stylosanthes scabra]|uniref:DUF4219 domain-containing protein n=1 Tax=Stylosanthes scabra TaxID=79078 RepID=A0ABU6YUC0_9FABA|nr:hypothetical protein [Stylosanthes scabra]
MASTSFKNNNNEGLSTTCPPLFNGTNYSYWKNKMKIWIREQDMKVWKVIQQGDHVPMKTSTTKKYPEREIITKVLRSLTSKWLSKANAIVEGVHYQSGTLTFDQLRGNLITYEITVLDAQNGENKKKSLALKASSQEEDSDENNDGEEYQDFALLMKQFNKFAKKKNFNFKGKKNTSKML